MEVHYIENFVIDCGLDCLDYYDCDILSRLNDYVSENVDTSQWNKCDMVRVSPTKRTKTCWTDNQHLFFWDGYNLIYPFYNGNLNDIGTNDYEIDQQVDSSGFVPNVFQAFTDFDPSEPHRLNNGICLNRIYFTNLSDYRNQISFSRYVVSSSYCGSNGILNIGSFYHGYKRCFVIVLGEINQNIEHYLDNNRPYDFDISSALQEHDMSIDMDDIYSSYDSSEDDYYLFIQPKFLQIDFDGGYVKKSRFLSNLKKEKYSTGSNQSVKNYNNDWSSNKKSFEKATVPNIICDSKVQCVAYTGTGDRCTRMSKEGENMCGIHLRIYSSEEYESKKCSAYTGKGDKCTRDAKDGHDMCGIHLRIYS
jgi:hypothetical protein